MSVTFYGSKKPAAICVLGKQPEPRPSKNARVLVHIVDCELNRQLCSPPNRGIEGEESPNTDLTRPRAGNRVVITCSCSHGGNQSKRETQNQERNRTHHAEEEDEEEEVYFVDYCVAKMAWDLEAQELDESPCRNIRDSKGPEDSMDGKTYQPMITR